MKKDKYVSKYEWSMYVCMYASLVACQLPFKNRDGYLTGRNQENDRSRGKPFLDHTTIVMYDNKTIYAQSVVDLCNESDQRFTRKPNPTTILSRHA